MTSTMVTRALLIVFLMARLNLAKEEYGTVIAIDLGTTYSW